MAALHPTPPSRPPGATRSADRLADFSTDRRMLLLCALALPIGAIGAVVAKALLWLIAVITNAAFFLRWSPAPATPAANHLGPWVVLVPALGALVVGLMARYGSEKIRGHGIPEALEAILLGRSLVKPRVAVLKPLSSAISIGTGGPFGAEGPIIVTGGAFGSIFAQLFHLSAAERKTLLVAGAAAGMAAVFATPVAAVLLAIEVLLFEWKPRSFLPVTLAAVTASVLRVPLLGASPLFPVIAHGALSASTLGIAVLVGLVVGLSSSALTVFVYGCEDLFHKLPIHWMWWPALGGLVVGAGGYLEPRALGVGYDTLHQMMTGQLTGVSLATLAIVKALIWAVALSSGTSGGILAPLLMIGGAIGSLCGVGLVGADPGLWAMVGMAAMMGGSMRAPLTGMAFVLELTHDLNALPALLLGSAAALGVTVLLLRRSILTEKLARRGQHISCEYSVDVFALARVADVMERHPPSAPGAAAVLIYPDETLERAIAQLSAARVDRLSVVERSDPTRVIGSLGPVEILVARTRRQDEEERRERGLWLDERKA